MNNKTEINLLESFIFDKRKRLLQKTTKFKISNPLLKKIKKLKKDVYYIGKAIKFKSNLHLKENKSKTLKQLKEKNKKLIIKKKKKEVELLKYTLELNGLKRLRLKKFLESEKRIKKKLKLSKKKLKLSKKKLLFKIVHKKNNENKFEKLLKKKAARHLRKFLLKFRKNKNIFRKFSKKKKNNENKFEKLLKKKAARHLRKFLLKFRKFSKKKKNKFSLKRYLFKLIEGNRIILKLKKSRGIASFNNRLFNVNVSISSILLNDKPVKIELIASKFNISKKKFLSCAESIINAILNNRNTKLLNLKDIAWLNLNKFKFKLEKKLFEDLKFKSCISFKKKFIPNRKSCYSFLSSLSPYFIFYNLCLLKIIKSKVNFVRKIKNKKFLFKIKKHKKLFLLNIFFNKKKILKPTINEVKKIENFKMRMRFIIFFLKKLLLNKSNSSFIIYFKVKKFSKESKIWKKLKKFFLVLKFFKRIKKFVKICRKILYVNLSVKSLYNKTHAHRNLKNKKIRRRKKKKKK